MDMLSAAWQALATMGFMAVIGIIPTVPLLGTWLPALKFVPSL